MACCQEAGRSGAPAWHLPPSCSGGSSQPSPRRAGPAVAGAPRLVSQELNANLSNLTSAFEKATAEKIKCQQEADSTNRVISLANR